MTRSIPSDPTSTRTATHGTFSPRYSNTCVRNSASAASLSLSSLSIIRATDKWTRVVRSRVQTVFSWIANGKTRQGERQNNSARRKKLVSSQNYVLTRRFITFDINSPLHVENRSVFLRTMTTCARNARHAPRLAINGIPQRRETRFAGDGDGCLCENGVIVIENLSENDARIVVRVLSETN